MTAPRHAWRAAPLTLGALFAAASCARPEHQLAVLEETAPGAPRVLVIGDSMPVPAGAAGTHEAVAGAATGSGREPGASRWRSSDTTIALVRGDMVHGRRYGLAVITRVDSAGSRDSVALIVTPPVLVGAGDIASCGMRQDEETARILDTIPGIVFTAGDNVYPKGTAEQFARCYGPTWGRHRWRTFPSAGNHDYKTRRGRPYYEYFGARAGERGRGWYAYDIGAWHVITINSVADVSRDSPQLTWLARDLAATRGRRCSVAIFHRPRYSVGPHGSSVWMQPLWHALYAGGVDVVITGHDHLYERFAPLDESGHVDPARGMREFVVGTGGRNLYRVEKRAVGAEVAITDQHGVLRLRLGDGAYEWAFIEGGSGRVGDGGVGKCR